MTKKQRKLSKANSSADIADESTQESAIQEGATQDMATEDQQTEDPSDQKEETSDEAQTETQAETQAEVEPSEVEAEKTDNSEEDRPEAGQAEPATAVKKDIDTVVMSEDILSGISAIPIASQIPTNSVYFDAEGEEDTEAMEQMNALVIVQFIERLAGCVTISVDFEFEKYSQWRVPKWFALQHGKKLVIRG